LNAEDKEHLADLIKKNCRRNARTCFENEPIQSGFVLISCARIEIDKKKARAITAAKKQIRKRNCDRPDSFLSPICLQENFNHFAETKGPGSLTISHYSFRNININSSFIHSGVGHYSMKFRNT
jgi:hypothetical protein